MLANEFPKLEQKGSYALVFCKKWAQKVFELWVLFFQW